MNLKLLDKSVLIFPYEGSIAEEAKVLFQQLGLRVICAHSENCGSGVFFLPYVTDPEFTSQLRRLVFDLDVTHMMSPHPVVWSVLASAIDVERFPVTLLGPSPYESDITPFRKAWQWAQTCGPFKSGSISVACDEDATTTLAGLYLGYFAISGQSDITKLEQLTSIMSNLQAGDIIEIGSLFGRSAFALSYLSRLFSIGSVLCVDPWSDPHARYQGSSAQMVNSAIMNRDFELVYRAFRTNRLIYGLENLDWVRKTSSEALIDYTNQNAFSRISTAGQIALLHIDGNHAFEAIRQDIFDWAPLVMRGGWIIIDDYLWPFGKGPRQAADEFLKERGFDIEIAYCSGDSIYIKLNY